MARKKANIESSLLDDVHAEKPTPENIDDMPLESLKDYVAYNKKARALNKKLGICRYPAKQCPLELHPKQRVIFNRKDQPRNPLPVYFVNDIIEYKKTLIPGQTYDLPLCILDYLAGKGTPIWDWVQKPDGSKETKKVATDPRFALRSVHSE